MDSTAIRRKPSGFAWHNTSQTDSVEYICGHCDRLVASNVGYVVSVKASQVTTIPRLRVCPNCNLPTLFVGKSQIPGIAPGNSVEDVPDEVNELYEEGRRCAAADAPTSAVLACRKLLMNIAVSQGAPEGQPFIAYVNYLAAEGYVPPNGKEWVDHIRKKGNEANHEIPHMTIDDAKELITFSEMLLKFIYEFPNRIPKAPNP